MNHGQQIEGKKRAFPSADEVQTRFWISGDEISKHQVPLSAEAGLRRRRDVDVSLRGVRDELQHKFFKGIRNVKCHSFPSEMPS